MHPLTQTPSLQYSHTLPHSIISQTHPQFSLSLKSECQHVNRTVLNKLQTFTLQLHRQTFRLNQVIQTHVSSSNTSLTPLSILDIHHQCTCNLTKSSFMLYYSNSRNCSTNPLNWSSVLEDHESLVPSDSYDYLYTSDVSNLSIVGPASVDASSSLLVARHLFEWNSNQFLCYRVSICRSRSSLFPLLLPTVL